MPGAAREITVGGQAGGAREAAAAGEEGPLVHVVDDELVLGQPGSGAAHVAVKTAGEQHGAGIDAVPAAAFEPDDGAQWLVDRRGETDPVQALSRQATDLFTEATDPVAVHLRQFTEDRLTGSFPDFWGATAGIAQKRGIAQPDLCSHDRRMTITATTASTAQTAEPAVSPESTMRIAAGFMAAKHLFVASELGLFEALADSPATLEALAARTGLTPRAARISADAMVALGLLDRDGDRYRNSPAAAAFLAGGAPGDL